MRINDCKPFQLLFLKKQKKKKFFGFLLISFFFYYRDYRPEKGEEERVELVPLLKEKE